MENRIDILTRYADLLAKWNLEFHFSKFTTVPDLLKHLIYPSLALSPLFPEGIRIIDLGCGPGIPGIPLAVLRPDLQILCLDSSATAIEFVAFSSKSLGLANIQAVSGRAESLAHDPEFRGSFDSALSRALTSIPIALEISSGFVKRCGSIIIQCSEGTSSALQSNDPLTLKLGCAFDRVGFVDSDLIDGFTNFACFRKIAETPSKFPRSWPAMKRRPIWKQTP
jgi:16S rRNA (guanine527-N7)-methyltransferase